MNVPPRRWKDKKRRKNYLKKSKNPRTISGKIWEDIKSDTGGQFSVKSQKINCKVIILQFVFSLRETSARVNWLVKFYLFLMF